MPARHFCNWTPDEEKLLLDMYRSGKCDKDIAASMGRSWQAVEKRRQKLGVKRKPPGRYWTVQRVRALKVLRHKRWSVARIAREFGRSKSSIIGAIHRYRAVIQTRKLWGESETRAALEAAAAGKSYEQIGFLLDRSAGSVQQRLIRVTSFHNRSRILVFNREARYELILGELK